LHWCAKNTQTSQCINGCKIKFELQHQVLQEEEEEEEEEEKEEETTLLGKKYPKIYCTDLFETKQTYGCQDSVQLVKSFFAFLTENTFYGTIRSGKTFRLSNERSIIIHGKDDLTYEYNNSEEITKLDWYSILVGIPKSRSNDHLTSVHVLYNGKMFNVYNFKEDESHVVFQLFNNFTVMNELE
jgi:hypothetical protein